MQLSPVRVMGSSSYSASSRMAKGRKPTVDQMSMTDVNVSKMARGFLWQPWVLQWDAVLGVGATTAQYTVFSAPDATQGGNDSLSRRVEGSTSIFVLPQSRFPFKAAFRRTQEDNSEGEPTRQARIGDTFTLAQNYQNKEQDMTVAANAEHFKGRMGTKNMSGAYGISIPSVDRYEDSTTLDTFSVSVQKRLMKQMVNVLGRMVRGSHITPEVTNENQDIMINGSHRYNVAKNWSVDTMGSVNNAHYAVEQHPRLGGQTTRQEQESTMLWKQISSFLAWRSEGMPVSAVASMRMADNRNTTETRRPGSEASGGWSASRAMNVMLGGSYDATQALRLGSNVVATQVDATSAEQEQTTQTASMGMQATYSPENRPLGPVTYRWFTSGMVDQQVGTDQVALTDVREQVGQSVIKDLPLTDTVGLSLSLNETGFASQRNRTESVWGVNHLASGRVSHFHDRGQSYLELSLGDSRALGGEENNAQLLSLQLTSDGSLWKDVRWRGNFSSQWTRRSVSSSLATAATTTGAAQDEVEINRFANASLSLMKPNLFGLRRLQLTSTVSADIMDSLVPLSSLVGQDGLAERRSWWNVLDYQIGKLAARLTVGGLEVETQKNGLNQEGLILFEFRRSFDTTF